MAAAYVRAWVYVEGFDESLDDDAVCALAFEQYQDGGSIEIDSNNVVSRSEED